MDSRRSDIGGGLACECVLRPIELIVRFKCEIIFCSFTDLSLQLIQFDVFRSASRHFSSVHYTRSAHTTRYFHRVTTGFIIHDMKRNLITRKVPVVISNLGETYVLVDLGLEVHSTLPALLHQLLQLS